MAKKGSSRQFQLSMPFERFLKTPKQRQAPPGKVSVPFQLRIHHRAPLAPLSLKPEDFPIVLPHPVELDLMRHGESAANAEKLVTGTANVPLTDQGIRQAQEVGRKLSPHYDAAFSSTLIRSRNTLREALRARRINGVRVKQSPCLDERRLGELELEPNRPVPEYSAGNFLFAPPGGENYESVTGRSLSFLAEIAHWIQEEWTERQHRVERILVCTHMGPLRIMAGILSGESDPAKVLSLSFGPAEVLKFLWKELSYPAFHFVGRERRRDTSLPTDELPGAISADTKSNS